MFLRERSADRIAGSEQFAEIEELRAKAAENQVVRIADLLEIPDAETNPSTSDADAKEEAGDASEPASDENANTPQLDEALKILVDLVSQKRVALH